MTKKIYILLLLLFSLTAFAQEKKDISEMTKEDVLELSYDELLEMPFEDVLKLADIVGVSMEELYEMLLNKDVVSASKKVESSFEAPLSTSVVSYDEIMQSGARSIEEALRLVPGLILREKTNGNFDIHVRGNDNLPPNHMFLYSENSITLVMIDGRPVYNYVHGGTFWETLPIGLDDVDRIEVVRGPSSALYGPNAVSGCVNIITKRVEGDGIILNANVQGGTQGTVISSFGVGKRLSDKLSFKVTGNFETMDRNTDKLYVHKSDWDGEAYIGNYLTKEELANLNDPNPSNAAYKVFDPNDDVNDMYPDPGLARQRYGANGYMFFDLTDDVKFDLKGGYQNSDIISSTMGDNPTSFVGRLSSTGYVDFNANVKGLKAQVNLLNGWQDIVKSDTGFKVDMMNVNASLEYDINVGGLNIRPGFSYQLGKYNDLEYLGEEGQGFLNGEREVNTTALSLRLDYTLFEKLRLIGAVRGEKHNTHDDPYLSYQLIASYNLNNMHNFRFVHSRANRGPFIVDNYANYLWDREGRPIPSFILFNGQTNLDLLTMNMFELGYRVKPHKKVQLDFELFYNKTDNYAALYPDSVNLLTAGVTAPWVRMSYSNINLTSEQIGLTAEMKWVVNEDLFLKVFGTSVLKSELKNYIPYGQDETITIMIQNAFLDPVNTHSTNFPNKRESGENVATPSYYGGIVGNYSLDENWNLNLNSYFYSSQEFRSKYGATEIDSKIVLNAKVSYKIKPEALLYVNVRNLLGKKQEFGFMDEIGPVVTGGLSINFK